MKSRNKVLRRPLPRFSEVYECRKEVWCALLAAMALNLVTGADVSASLRPGAAMQSHEHEIVAMIVKSSVRPEC